MKRRKFLNTAAAATVGAGAIPIRALAQQKITWRMQTVAGAGTMEFKDLAQAFADRARELSAGRIDIQVFPAGALMNSAQVAEAVGKGAIDFSNTFLVYMSGKEPAMKSINEWPALVDPLQAVIWTYHGGGLPIMREITAGHGIFYLGASPVTGEHIWSKKPLKSLADLKGLKMRASGLAADSFRKHGAAVVTMPGEELYQGLQRGIVDAAEFTTAAVNYGMGLHEVTKYMVFPTYSGGGSYDWIVNKKKWDETPPDLQKILNITLSDISYQFWLKTLADERRVVNELKAKGMQFIIWPDADLKEMEKGRIEIMRDVYAKDSALFAKKLESQLKFLAQLGYTVPK